MREVYNLNFNWFFSKENIDEHITEYENVDEFETVDLPHSVEIPLQYFNEQITQMTSTYKKEIYIQKEWKGRILNLVFEGVAHIAHIFIGDAFVMTHRGGYDCFKVNISDYVGYGKNNMITVVVDSHENVFIPPFGGPIDFLGYGGIYREVSLEVLETSHIEDFFIKTFDPVNDSTVTVDINLSIDEGILEACLYDGDIEVIRTKTIVTDRHTILKLDYNNKVLWSIFNPHLYRLELLLYQDDILVDKVSDKFGYRKAEFKEGGFYLNDELIELRGLSRHQSYPYVGNAMPKSAQIEDADILKYQLGLNIVRTANCPPSKHFLNRCDEIGLLVYEEIPGWSYVGDKEWQEVSLNNLKAMINRDKNHPSVVLWGVRVSGSNDYLEFYQRTNALAHSLDDTRQTGGSRSIQNGEFLEDVYTFDDYTYKQGKYILKKKQVKKDVPYLITAHTGPRFPTKSYDNKVYRLEQGLRHLDVINAALAPKSGIAGVIGWTMNDYNTHSGFGSENKIAYYGVLDIFRIPKLAAFAYASQREREPFLEITSNLYIGEGSSESLKTIYGFTNCEYISLYRNGEFINSFYPDKQRYPYLKHPPIIIDDFIGGDLEKYERFSHKDNNEIKVILKRIENQKGNIPLKFRIRLLLLAQKYHMSYDQFMETISKYNRISKDNIYRFDGHIGNAVVKSVTLEKTITTDYLIETSRTTLVIEDTYDVQRFVIKKVNQVGQLLVYGFDPIKIEVSGCLDLIGPSEVNLYGGVIGFWVKTNGERGIGTIKIIGETTKIVSVIVK